MEPKPRRDADHPPPCPWCGKETIRELTLLPKRSTARYFHCDTCRLTFLIDIVPFGDDIVLKPDPRHD